MATALLAWELGGGYGHLAPLRLLALHLRTLGHRCVFVVRDVGKAEGFLDPSLGPVLQAPLREGAGRSPVKTQLSYASLLHNIGFDDDRGLAGRIRAWRELMRAARCELVYVHHAPTAVAAARLLDLPTVVLGSGFVVPPLQQPFPAWSAQPVPTQLLARNEAVVLARLNAALARLGAAPWASLQALFAGAERALLSYPELDHYPHPRDEPYFGLPDMASGARPVWPQQRAPRVFAYLRPFPGLARLLQALKDSGAHVLVRIGDLPAARLRGYLRANMVITDQSVHMRLAAESCDAYVNYAAHGTVCEMLHAGRPGLLIPTTVERGLVAARAVALGAALQEEDRSEGYAAAIGRLLVDRSLSEAARRFAERHDALDRGVVMSAVAELGLSRVRGGSAAASPE